MLFLAASAQAGQITFNFDFSTLQIGTLYLNRGSAGWLIEGVYAGEGIATVQDTGQSFETYCVDLLHDIYSGESPTVQYGSMQDWTQSNLGGSNPTAYPWINNPQAGEAAAYLYDTFAGQANDMYKQAGLQLAIWEVLYEGNTSGTPAYNIGSGNIYFTGFNSQVTGFATNYLNSIPDSAALSGYDALWIETANYGSGLHSHDQDFIGPSEVPEPIPLLLVSSGMILIGGDVLRRRRKIRKS